MWVVWIIAGIVGLLALAAGVLWLLGSRLPQEHTAARTIMLNRSPEEVWAVVADSPGHRDWVRGITGLERLPDRNGHEVWRQRMGRNSFVLETTDIEPGTRLVRTIADDHNFFGGSWEYLVSPHPGGTRVTITERGRVFHAIPRAMMEYALGKDTYLKRQLEDLAHKFGEPARFV